MDDYLIQKRKVGELKVGEGFDPVELFSLEITDPQKLIALKPKNSKLGDNEWIVVASMFGIAHAWNHDYQDWYLRQWETGVVEPYDGPQKGDPALFFRHHFGKAGEEGYRLAGTDDCAAVAEAMRNRPWPIEQLGIFGTWLAASGVPPAMAGEIMYEYLTD